MTTEELLALSDFIRYVAIYRDQNLETTSRPTSNQSSSESDRYEELIVNPAVLCLTTQRGDIDCGGLEYVLIRYGNFFQLVCPTAHGHVSVCIEASADPVAIAKAVMQKIG